MYRFQEIFTIESSFECTISHTWDLINFRIELKELRLSTKEIFKWKLKNDSQRKKSRELNEIGMRQILVFQIWIESSWISKCNWLSDERSNISIVSCCTIRAELNHSFFQLQMMMKMIMNNVVENGLTFLKGVHSGTRGKVKERWNSHSYSMKNDHLYKKITRHFYKKFWTIHRYLHFFLCSRVISDHMRWKISSSHLRTCFFFFGGTNFF